METHSVLPNGGDTVLRSVLINPVSFLVFTAWGFLYPAAKRSHRISVKNELSNSY